MTCDVAMVSEAGGGGAYVLGKGGPLLPRRTSNTRSTRLRGGIDMSGVQGARHAECEMAMLPQRQG
ncbi:hypothetical protein [Sphingomonas sp. SORGH_AS_0879]|uniref:hypothetical protein n=1 Tax=Sphingomonas sp. SORGH_AS_0879 TaxID=3041790 RepID=UPI002785C414|nr:hypothetical protein [Sphingomonas sp. SORGH_AS_0879]MDQ1232442.1 hypothetical protein [Sphingomonas sp. SORGH_AS_0879]